jgi:hypothetical protein
MRPARHLLAAILLGLGLAAGATACRQGSRPAASPATAAVVTPDDVVAAGKGIVEQYRQAYEVKSLEALAPLYSQGLDVVLVQQGKALFGWSAVEARLEEVLGGASAIHVRVGDVAVTAVGSDAAAVTAAMTREISEGSTTVQETGILTLNLRRTEDRWLIVTEHYSYASR